jgi:hypothetical protein
MHWVEMKPVYAIPFFFVLLSSASVAAATEGSTAEWSSSDPLAIPYEIRREQFEKGNLVMNPSFEEGVMDSENGAPSFSIRGWEVVGKNIQWLHSELDREAVSDGQHSVKIERAKVDEVAEAEGILSDYIPVIPGNYDFFYDIRLKNILNNRSRLGVRVYDAVSVKVLYFDKAKKPLDPAALNPVNRKRIDSSDKSYSFSNYWRIPDFPWGKVRGRTYNYPFSEGDIPDQTRFVRLFFGLKGTGTMWLDHVVYRFSKWNFSALERMRPQMAIKASPAERIIPAPKFIKPMEAIHYYDPGSPQCSLPSIILPDEPTAGDLSAARVLREKLDRVIRRSGLNEQDPAREMDRVGKDSNWTGEAAGRLVFSIGKSGLYNHVQPVLPLHLIEDKPQGYVIKAQQVGDTHVVFLMGGSSTGNFYAATTAMQLLGTDRCIYHSADVVDFPDFEGRGFFLKRWEKLKEEMALHILDRLGRYKLNKIYTAYDHPTNPWYDPDAAFKRGLERIGGFCKESGIMRLAVMVNPYAHFDFEASEEDLDDQARSTWTHSSPQSLEVLKEAFRIGLEAGADTIMLRADDYMPHEGVNRKNFSLYTAEDRARFVNLQNGHAFLINSLKLWLEKDHPATRFEFCPPWYANEFIDRSEGKAEIYFRELTAQIPRDVAIIWTGPTVRSLSIDMADIRRYQSLIERWPMSWDNTLYARNIESKSYGGYAAFYPGKVRMCNLFEPYDTYRPERFHQYNDGAQMYVNGNGSTEIYQIKYATVADYLWNTSAYDPDRSLWVVLSNDYGPVCARDLLLLNDAYYGLYDVCLRIEMEGVRDEWVAKGRVFLGELTQHLGHVVGQLPPEQPILKELEVLRNRQEERFNRLCELAAGGGSPGDRPPPPAPAPQSGN